MFICVQREKKRWGPEKQPDSSPDVGLEGWGGTQPWQPVASGVSGGSQWSGLAPKSSWTVGENTDTAGEASRPLLGELWHHRLRTNSGTTSQ